MKQDSKNINPSLLVLVSNLLTGPDGVPVGFAFRSKAADPEDSGWNFWSGEETEDYIKDPDNFSRFPIGRFLKLDDSLLDIIESEVGTSWERDPDSGDWAEAEE